MGVLPDDRAYLDHSTPLHSTRPLGSDRNTRLFEVRRRINAPCSLGFGYIFGHGSHLFPSGGTSRGTLRGVPNPNPKLARLLPVARRARNTRTTS